MLSHSFTLIVHALTCDADTCHTHCIHCTVWAVCSQGPYQYIAVTYGLSNAILDNHLPSDMPVLYLPKHKPLNAVPVCCDLLTCRVAALPVCYAVLYIFSRFSMFNRAFFNSIIDKHQHMYFFTFKTLLVIQFWMWKSAYVGVYQLLNLQ